MKNTPMAAVVFEMKENECVGVYYFDKSQNCWLIEWAHGRTMDQDPFFQQMVPYSNFHCDSDIGIIIANDGCRLFLQLKSGEIQQFDTTLEYSLTYGDCQWTPGVMIEAEVMPGTRLSFIDLNMSQTSNPKMHGFFQDVDGNVVEYVRDKNDGDRWKPTGFQINYEGTTYRTPIAATRYKSKGKLRTCLLTHNPMNQLQYQQSIRGGSWEATPTILDTLCNVPCGTLTVDSHSYDSIETEVRAYVLAPLHVIKEVIYKVDKHGEKWVDREYKESYIDLGGDARHIATRFYV